MAIEHLEFNVWDFLSVVFGGVGAGMGVALTFLPTPLPGFLSVSLIGAFAVLFTAVSLLIQAISIEESEDQDEMIELPVSVYNSHLASARKTGYYEGQHDGYRKREQIDEQGEVPRENYRIDRYREISKNRKLSEFSDKGEDETKTQPDSENEQESGEEDEQEESEEYPQHVVEKVNELEEEVEKELEYE